MELSDILNNGVTILNKKVFEEFRAIVCDAPARAWSYIRPWIHKVLAGSQKN